MARAFTVVDVPQRTPEWFAARLGRVTGSVASDMLAKTKTGWGASRENLKWRLVLERMTNRPQEPTFTSAAMQAGIEREASAIAAYEAHTGLLVQTCGFLRHDSLMVGASLDGYLGDYETLISIKCRQPKAHAEHLLTRRIPADALAQMRHELWLTGAKAHQYVSFNPDFPEHLQLMVKRVQRDDKYIKVLALAVEQFLAEVCEEEAYFRKIDNKG